MDYFFFGGALEYIDFKGCTENRTNSNGYRPQYYETHVKKQNKTKQRTEKCENLKTFLILNSEPKSFKMWADYTTPSAES